MVYEETRATSIHCTLNGSHFTLEVRGHSEQTVPCNIVIQNLSEPLSISWNGTELPRRDSEQVLNKSGEAGSLARVVFLSACLCPSPHHHCVLDLMESFESTSK
jgi:hypothetical protein